MVRSDLYSGMAARNSPHSKTKIFREIAITLENKQRSLVDVEGYAVIAGNTGEAEGDRHLHGV